MQIFDSQGFCFSFKNFVSNLYLPIISTNQIRFNILSIISTKPFIISIESNSIFIYDSEKHSLKSYQSGTHEILIYESYSNESIQTNTISFITEDSEHQLNFITESINQNQILLNQVNSISPIPFQHDDNSLYNINKKDFIKQDTKLREILLEFPKEVSNIGNINYTKKFFKLIEIDNYNLIELRKTNFGLNGTDFKSIYSNESLTTGDYLLEIGNEQIFEDEFGFNNFFDNNEISLFRINKILKKIHEFIFPVGTRIIEVANSIHYNSPCYLLSGSTISENINCSFNRNFKIQSNDSFIMKNNQFGFVAASHNNIHLFDLTHYSINLKVFIWERNLNINLTLNDKSKTIHLDDFINLINPEQVFDLFKIYFKNFYINYKKEIIFENNREIENYVLYITHSKINYIDFHINNYFNEIEINKVDLRMMGMDYISDVMNQRFIYGNLVRFNLVNDFVLNEFDSFAFDNQFKLNEFLNYKKIQPMETRLEDSSIDIEILHDINLNEDSYITPNILDLNFFEVSFLKWNIYKGKNKIFEIYKKVENDNFLEYFFDKSGFYTIEMEIYYYSGLIQNVLKEIEIKVPKISISLLMNDEDENLRFDTNGDYDMSNDMKLRKEKYSFKSLERLRSIKEPKFFDIERSSNKSEMFLGSVFNNSWKINNTNGSLIIYKKDVKERIESATNLNINDLENGYCEVFNNNEYISNCIYIKGNSYFEFLKDLEYHRDKFYFRSLEYRKNKSLINGLLFVQNQNQDYCILGLNGIDIEKNPTKRIEYLNHFEHYSIYGFSDYSQVITIDNNSEVVKFITLYDFLDWLKENPIVEYNPIYDKENEYYLVCIELINTNLLNIKFENFYLSWKKEEENLKTNNYQNIKILKDKIIHSGAIQLQLNHDANEYIPEKSSYLWTISTKNFQYEYKEKYPIIFLTELGTYDINLNIKTENGNEINAKFDSWITLN